MLCLSSQDIRKIEGLEEGAELERLLLNVVALAVMDLADQHGLSVCLMDFLKKRQTWSPYIFAWFGKIIQFGGRNATCH